jgi:hypothetical protein
MLTDCQLNVLSPGNYICDIHKLDFLKMKSISTHSYRFIETSHVTYLDGIMHTNQMYLVNNLLTDESYWAILNVGSNGIYFKLICKINIKDGRFETLYEPKCRIIYEDNYNGYSIYKTSVPLFRIPASYKIIPNDKKKWGELCDTVIKYNVNRPISYIINISDLRQFINEFF